MPDKNEWQARMGDKWAQEWQRTDLSFSRLTPHLLTRIAGQPSSRILDIGCGAGETAIALAKSHPQIKIVGLDISPSLIEIARQRARAEGANVTFVNMDALRWQAEDGFAPDLLISRHGVMFFDDPSSAFGHLADVAAPAARLVFSCFRSTDENPFFTKMSELLPAPDRMVTDPTAPGPFAFADKDRVRSILQDGGWGDIAFEAYDYPAIAGEGRDAVLDAVTYFTTIGPAARAMAQMETMEKERLREGIREIAMKNCSDGIVSLPAAVWIVSATKR
ncbi:class I SAM-dependent methyltransferase [Altericroceibacterium spongiae]|uniref:Class I SAM-dependent methyltransferase n=1 Tax=Altericroceibacterium spongiae TaxID=2320269 RepID=A0A420EEW3_9SPHN|nr:class I SAM-dependent methyltransferase [Altericroceibacterium spongiae]RKF19210.1 class I SAM-dependent methyltransferase [Altericroceibacterium spongiae]